MSDFHCDILILGAGPAGMAAALAAAQNGKQVLVLDDNPATGGQIWRQGPAVKQPKLAQRYRDAVAADANIRLLVGAKLVALGTGQTVVYEQADRQGVIQYAKLILCCGARELLLPFPGWTLPGVTGAGGLQAQIKQGLSLHGERVVIAGSGPLLLAVADTVKKAGGDVVLVAEQAAMNRLVRFSVGLWRWPAKIRQAMSLYQPKYRVSSHVLAAEGKGRLESVRVSVGGRERNIPCDRLACGFGLVANIEPAMLFNCRIDRQSVAVDAYQQTSVEGIYAAGECTGVGGGELALVEGTIAGLAAAGNRAQADTHKARRDHWQRFADGVASTFALGERLKTLATPETLLCRCEDVPLAELEGASDWVSAKLSSRCGMGACQGKICATAARHLYGWPLPAPRVPLSPVRVETLLQQASKTP